MGLGSYSKYALRTPPVFFAVDLKGMQKPPLAQQSLSLEGLGCW